PAGARVLLALLLERLLWAARRGRHVVGRRVGLARVGPVGGGGSAVAAAAARRGGLGRGGRPSRRGGRGRRGDGAVREGGLGGGVAGAVAAAAGGQEADRDGGEGEAPDHVEPSSAGWRSPQYGQSLTSSPIS